MVDLGNKLSEVETPTSSVGKMRSKKRRSKSGSQKRRLSQKKSSAGSAVPSSVALAGSSEMQVTFPANGVGPIVEQHVADCWQSETPISKSSKPAVDVESMNAVAGDVAVPYQREISACSRDEVDFQTTGSAPETLMAQSQTVIEIESIRTLPNILSTTSHTPIEIESVSTLEENVSAPSQTRIEIEIKSVATLEEAKTAIEIESVGILEEAAPAPSQTEIEIESVGTFPDAITGQTQNAISTCLELDSEMVDLGNKLSEVETPTSSFGKMRSKKRRSKSGSQKRRLSQKQRSVGSAVPSSVALAASSEMQVTFTANGVVPIVEQHVADCWPFETPISKSSKPAVDVELMNAVPGDVAVPFRREISVCSRDEVDFQTAGTESETLMEPSQTVIEIESVGTLPNILSTTSHTAIQIESVATLEENVSAPSQTGIEIDSLGTFPDAITGQSQSAILTCLELDSEMVDLGNKLSEVETPTSSVGKMRSKKRRSKSGSQKRRLSQKQSSVGSAVPSSVALAASSEMQVTFTANGVGPIVEQHVADCWPSETPISKSSKPAVDVESMNAVAGDVAVPFQRDISACSRDEVDFQTAGTAPETLMEQSQTVIEIESVRTLPNILSTTSHTPIEIESVSTLEENVSAPSQTGIEIEIESVATLEEAKTAIEIESVGILEEAAPAPSQTEIEIESVGTFPDAITGQSQNAISTCLELDSEMVDLGNKLSEVETPTSSFEKMRSKKRRSKSGSQKRRLSQKKSSVRSVALAGSSEMQVTFPANGVGPIVEQHVADCWQSETPISKSSKPAVDVESMNAVAGDVAVPFQRDISACSRDEVDFQTAGTAPETLMEQSQTVIEIESVGTLPNILSTTSHTAIQIESVATLEENVSAPSQTGIEIDSLGTFPDAITGQSQSAILTCLELDSEMVDLGNKLSEVEIPTSSVGKMRSKKRCSKSGSQETRLSQKQSSVGSAVPSSVALAGSSEMQVTFSANGVGPIVEQHVADCWPSETPISKSSKPAVDVESMNAVAGDVAVPFQREISACSRDEVDFQTAGSAPETLMEQSQTVFEFESVRTLPNILSTTSHTPIEIESVATLDENVSAPSQTGIKIESVATLEEAKTTNEAESLGTLEEAVPARSQTEIEIESVGTFPDAITGQSQNAISTCLELDSEMVDLGNKLSEVETPTSSVGKMRSKKRRSKSGSQKRRLSQKQSSVRSAVPSSVVLAGSSEMQVTFAANGVGPIVEQHVADCWPSETPISKSSKPAVDVESMNAVAGDVAVPFQREISACSRDEVDFQTAGSAPETLMEQSQTVFEIESVRTLPNILSTTSHTPIEIESVATLDENVSAPSHTGIKIESVATLEEAKTAIEAESLGTLEEAVPAPSQTEIEIESVGTFPDVITGQSQSAILTCLELDSEMVDLGNKLSEVETPTSSVGKMRSKKRRSKSGSQKRRLSQKQSSVGSAVPSSVALAGSSEMQVTFSANGVGPIVEQHVADCWPSETPISKSSKPAVDVESMNAVAGDVAVPFQREISACSRDEVDFQTAGSAPETLMEQSQTVFEIESVRTLPNILSTTSHTPIEIESVATLDENVSAPSHTGIKIESVATLEEAKTAIEAESLGTLEEAVPAPSQTEIEIESVGTFPDAITGQSQNAISTCLELDSEMVDLGNKLSEVETPTSSVGKMRLKKRRSKSGSQKRRLSQKQSSVGSAVPSSVALAGSSEMQVTFTANGVGPIVEQHVADCWPSETSISKSSKPAVDVELMNAVQGDVAVPFRREISACSRDEVDFQTAGTAPDTLMEPSQTVIEIESIRTLPNILSTTSHTPIEIESDATLEENVSPRSQTGIEIESVATLEEAKTAIEAESLGTLEEAVPAPSQTEIEIESVGTFPDAITGQSQNAISTCLELDSEMVDLGNKLSEVETPTSSVGKMRSKKRRSKSGSQKRRLSQRQRSVGSAVPSSVALTGSSVMQATFAANGVGPIVEQHVADCWPSETPISKSSKPAVDVESMNAVAEDCAVSFQREISACSRDEVDFQTAGTAPETLVEPSQTVIEIESIRTLPNILSTTSHTPIEIESVATLEENVSAPSQTGIEIELVATLQEAKTAIEAESVGILEEAVPAPSQTVIEIESVGSFPDVITAQSQNAISTCLELDSEMVDLGNKLSEVETPTSSVGKMRSKKRRSKTGSQKRRLSQKESRAGSAVPSSVALAGSSEMQVTFAANGVGPIVEQHVADCWQSETPISKSSKPAVDVESMNAVAEDVAVPFQREISACSRDEVDFQTAGTAPEALMEPSQTVIEFESVHTLPNILSTTSHTPIEIESVATLEENVSVPSQTGIEIESVATLEEGTTAIEAESVGTLEEAVPAPSQTVIEIESVGTFPDAITGQSQNAISTCLELESEMVDLGNKLSEVETPTSSVGKVRSKERCSKSGSQKRRLSQKESRVGSAVRSSVALAGSSEMQVTFAANGVGPTVEQPVADCWPSETPISKSSKPAVDVESMNAVAEDVAAPSALSQNVISTCPELDTESVDLRTKVLEGETSVSGDTDVRSSRRVSHKSGPRKRRLSQKHSSAELDVPSLEASTRSSKSQGSCGLRECGTPGSSCSQETEKVDWDTNLLPDYSPVSRLRTIGPRRRSCYKGTVFLFFGVTAISH